MPERLTRSVLRWRLLVVALWLAVIGAGAWCSLSLPTLLSTSLAVPGTASQRADDLLARHFGENLDGTFTVVVRAPHLSSAAASRLRRRLQAAARSIPRAAVGPLQPGAGVVGAEVATPLDLETAAAYTPVLRRALARQRLGSALVTGPPALQHDVTPILAGDLHRGELIALAVALAVSLAVIGWTPLAVVPFVVAAATTGLTLLVVYGLAHAVLMDIYVPNLVELIGLGLAIDYSLLIVRRFFEERQGPDGRVATAVAAAMSSAGRTVVLSGTAVAVGLAALLLVPVPFIASLGIAGLVVPLASVLCAVSLQPALLSLLGGGGLPRRLRAPQRRRAFSSRLASAVVRHRHAALGGSLLVMAGLAAPAAFLRVTPGSVTAIPRTTPSAQGVLLLRQAVAPGALTPLEIVIDGGGRAAARTPAMSAAVLRLARSLLAERETYIVAIGSRPPYVDPTGRYRLVVVVGRHDFGTPAEARLVAAVRGRLLSAARFPAGTKVVVGGTPAQGVDFVDRVYSGLGWIALLVAGLAYVVLARTFRSLLLPLMALVLDALSLLASYGFLVLVFETGAGRRLAGLYEVPAVEAWVPVFLLAMLFGLSMDYEVFLVSRMRELFDAGSETAGAVEGGIARTGLVVTAAAIVMVASLSGLWSGRVAGLQELGVGLAFGVLVDATIVRGLLLPSAMALCGRRNWWLPDFAARLLRVEASPPAREGLRGFEGELGPALPTSPP